MDEHQFQQELAARGLPNSPAQLAQFKTYYSVLVAENEKMNLTAITALGDVYLKHFLDSILLTQAAPQVATPGLKLCDVGAGAGFPSLPVKILYPDLDVTIVDSLNKRIGFLDLLCHQLGLERVHLFHDRAETFAGKKSPHREAYDLVTARAVAPLNVLAELCLPLVKVGGQFVAMKGSRGESELAQAKSAIAQLGGKLVETIDTTLPETGDPRSLVVIQKVAATPKQFPRKPGTPSKAPLGAH
ncbi:16S rRNA (guanine(527)-N(7))-methyltransferase RsmG [Lacticaseibacillus daqingensis]|uniref:16S rRNA (guanine(527)-N(7))-methyltransferase RsmG n=1 Tax=Lacticaseibacillus daqingensis TaxID=2486014 RepID=UPI000F7AF41F|nr:16S rRNA (guanine(527)-N(7))-methyltransferase RsmG [Lacticaseibacillus daqingensis]